LDDSQVSISSNFESGWLDYSSFANVLSDITLSFWYQNARMPGIPVVSIYIEYLLLSQASTNNWQQIKVLTSEVLTWSQQQISLISYKSQVFKLRFRVSRSASGKSDFSLDDISISLTQSSINPISSSSQSTSVAGIIIGVLLGICALFIIALVIYFLIWRKRKAEAYDFKSRRGTLVNSRRPTIVDDNTGGIPLEDKQAVKND